MAAKVPTFENLLPRPQRYGGGYVPQPVLDRTPDPHARQLTYRALAPPAPKRPSTDAQQRANLAL